jgi:hypothetical protein
MQAQRIPSTHVGSLVRPPAFASLLRRRLESGVADSEYLPALKSAVAEVVKQQAAAGIDIVSDGEYGKGIAWEQYVIERLSGFGPRVTLATEGGVAFGDFARFKEFYEELWPKEGYLEGIFLVRRANCVHGARGAQTRHRQFAHRDGRGRGDRGISSGCRARERVLDVAESVLQD